MKKQCISKQWKFSQIPTDGIYIDIDLPHDYAVSKPRDPNGDPSNGFFQLGCGKYIKYLNFKPGKHYVLMVDGAYSLSEVNLNEHLIAQHPHGYTPYLVDLTDHILPEITNKLVITTNPIDYSTRWYSGAGIYRDVFLYEGGNIRIEPWDLFVSVKEVANRQARLSVKYTVATDEDAQILVRFLVGTETKEVPLSVQKGDRTERETEIVVENPAIWDIDSPNLYTLRAEIYRDGVVLDESECTFGIKTFRVNVTEGLVLNGRPIKLRGGCIHHDHGALGARALPAAEERKIRLLKEAGFNAVRIAHNPPSEALLEVCDRLGMLVMDEAFDVWNKRKFVTHDYHIFFREWWQRDIEAMVKRDRNHACVLSYSIGNEIYEIDCTSDGAEWSEKLTAEVKKYDDTKLVTAAIQKISLAKYRSDPTDPEDYQTYMHAKTGNGDDATIVEITKPIEAPLDIVGCNYYHKKYELFHAANPDTVIWGSENWNIGTDANIYDYWQNVLNQPYNIGDFQWTAIDNLGEVGHGAHYWEGEREQVYPIRYPWRTCNQGDLDLCGSRRPQSYFRESVWFDNTPLRIFVAHPKYFGKAHFGTRWHWNDVDETWTFDDCYVGKPISCEAYTSADYVLWYVNGREVGKTIPEKNIATLHTLYEKGVIKAESYRNGQKISEAVLYTADAPSTIALKPEKTTFRADGRDLCYISVSVTDAQGTLVTDYPGSLFCQVTGGKLEAFFCADPMGDDQFPGPVAHTYKGKALAVISAEQPGTVTVRVVGETLPESIVTITAE